MKKTSENYKKRKKLYNLFIDIISLIILIIEFFFIALIEASNLFLNCILLCIGIVFIIFLYFKIESKLKDKFFTDVEISKIENEENDL